MRFKIMVNGTFEVVVGIRPKMEMAVKEQIRLEAVTSGVLVGTITEPIVLIGIIFLLVPE
jgi:hypothetical protein